MSSSEHISKTQENSMNSLVSRIEKGEIRDSELYRIEKPILIKSSLFTSGECFLTKDSYIGAFYNPSLSLMRIRDILQEKFSFSYYTWPEHLEIYNKGIELIVFNRIPGIFGILKRFPQKWNIGDISTKESLIHIMRLLEET